MINVSTPAIWYPGQTELEFEDELNLMMARSAMTSTFLNGDVSPDQLLDFINDQGFDIFEVAADWELENDLCG